MEIFFEKKLFYRNFFDFLKFAENFGELGPNNQARIFLSKLEFAEDQNYRITCVMLTHLEFERIFSVKTTLGAVNQTTPNAIKTITKTLTHTAVTKFQLILFHNSSK